MRKNSHCAIATQSYNGRYTLSLHKRPGERAHLDLFLDTGAELLTHYYLPLADRRRQSVCQIFRSGWPHRRLYLNFSGKLSQNRGQVRIISRGRWKQYCTGAIQNPLVKVRLPKRLSGYGRKSNFPLQHTS